MMFGGVNGCSTMMRGPLGLIISEDCAYAPELMQAKLDELDQVVTQVMIVLSNIQAFVPAQRSRADAISRALWGVWEQFNDDPYVGRDQEPVEKWIHQDAMDHICAGITMATDLAEASYMDDVGGVVAEEYGTLIRLMAQLRDKYAGGALPEEKIRPIGPVILMIAGITGLGVLAAHIVSENAKMERRRAPARRR